MNPYYIRNEKNFMPSFLFIFDLQYCLWILEKSSNLNITSASAFSNEVRCSFLFYFIIALITVF